MNVGFHSKSPAMSSPNERWPVRNALKLDFDGSGSEVLGTCSSARQWSQGPRVLLVAHTSTPTASPAISLSPRLVFSSSLSSRGGYRVRAQGLALEKTLYLLWAVRSLQTTPFPYGQYGCCACLPVLCSLN